MKRLTQLLPLGLTLALSACAEPPLPAGDAPASATGSKGADSNRRPAPDRRKVEPSPIQPPAEVDPVRGDPGTATPG